MNDLYDFARAVFERLGEVDRRIGGMVLRGRVAEVDAAKHMVRVVIGQNPEGDDVLSPFLPVAQVAGALKVHSMPSVGQQVSVKSANGDIQQGAVEPLHWSDGFSSPSDDPDKHIITLGDVTVTTTAHSLEIAVGGSVLSIADGLIRVVASHVSNEGARLTHNEVNVGDTHVHGGVMTGGSDTAVPH